MNCCFVELLGAPFPSGTWNYKNYDGCYYNANNTIMNFSKGLV